MKNFTLDPRAGIPQDDVGGVVQAIILLWDAEGHSEWENRVHSLARAT